MFINQSKKYFGIVGSNQKTVETIYHCLADKISTKIITSLDDITKLNGSLGAIAYVMDYPSEVHSYNLEQIYKDSPHTSLYIISNQISIPLLHHALRLRARDIFKLPLDNKTLDKLSLEVSETTNIECIEHVLLPSRFIPPTEELINHPLENLFDIIEQHFVDGPSLLQVSTSIYLSPSRISHMFKDLCGIGYSQYILCRRLEESEYLLSQENAIITNITFEVGFSNPSHFCRSFKEHIGLTPTAYIKNERGIELSCLYHRYQQLRMELLPVSKVKQNKRRYLANS
ncbi:MAG: AraC-like DNA-binding protein [Paraglaciecola sp.]|jgi:AraC-like DNA-binding protein